MGGEQAGGGMKLPFSYKHQVFGSILAASFIGHLTFISFGSFFSPSPQYAVEEAPSSMEVMIINEREVKEEKKQIPEEVVSVKDLTVQASEIVKEKKKEEEEKKLRKPIYIPPVKGALAEAKPAYFKNPAPVYPNYAREQGWKGVVVLKVLVNEYGAVSQDRKSTR